MRTKMNRDVVRFHASVYLMLLILVSILSGCATESRYVRKSAALDFQCAEETVEVEEAVNSSRWKATGCGKAAEYTCGGCSFGTLRCNQATK